MDFSAIRRNRRCSAPVMSYWWILQREERNGRSRGAVQDAKRYCFFRQALFRETRSDRQENPRSEKVRSQSGSRRDTGGTPGLPFFSGFVFFTTRGPSKRLLRAPR